MKKHSSKSSSPLPIFTDRFCSLFRQGETQEAFGNRVGLVRNTVAQYYNGHRIPDSITLRQICERCNVSADWLLGLSDEKLQDVEVQALSKYTGLSSDAYKNLMLIKQNEDKASFILDLILSGEETVSLFNEYLCDVIVACSFPELAANTLEVKRTDGKVLEPFEIGEYLTLHAGHCMVKIIDEIKQSGCIQLRKKDKNGKS